MRERWLAMARFGEISLKGRIGRIRMEKKLVENISDALKVNSVSASVSVSGGRVWICCFKSEEEAVSTSNILSYVMGIVSVSPVFKISFSSLDDLNRKASEFFSERVKGKSFAVRARRVGVHNFTSRDVEKVVGASLLQHGAKVDLENPEYVAYIEIRGGNAYLYDRIIKGPGGLPLGSEGKVLSLFSGGIDSPVATWFALKRGCSADLLLFNIGGDRHVWSVAMVAKVLVDKWFYGYSPRMYVVDARPLIAKIALSAPENYVVVLLRRAMNKIGERLAQRIGALALVTGESLGQVASQTLANLYIVEEAVKMPIIRPLIGMDKEEITMWAKKIGTYEYSIKVEEYCSLGARTTTPRAELEKVVEYEHRMGLTEEEIDRIIDEAQTIELRSITVDQIVSRLESLGLGDMYRCRV